MKIPFVQNYAACMRSSLSDNGDGLHISRRGVLFPHYATTAEYVRFLAMHTAVLSFAGMTQLLSSVLFERLKQRRKTQNHSHQSL